MLLHDTSSAMTAPSHDMVRVAHLVALLKNSSGIPPAALGICESMRLAGGQTELFAGYAEPSFEPGTVVPCRVFSDTRLGRRFGWSVQELENVRRRRAEGWALHVHGLWSGANFAERWSRPVATASPFILSPHGMFSLAALARSRWRKRLIWWLGQRRQVAAAKVIHVTSEAERDDVRAAGVTLPIACLPLPVRTPLSPVRRPDSDRPLSIGFLGRIAPIKRIELLIDAFAMVFGNRDEARLFLAGPVVDVGYDAILHKRTNGWSSVCWLGEVSDQSKDRFFEEIDLLVLPSASENFGVVVTEALSRGVSVAAARGTPWKELPDRRLGFHGFDDVAGLASVLSEARALGRNGLAALGEGGPVYVAAHYSYETVGARWIALHHWMMGHIERPDWVEVQT